MKLLKYILSLCVLTGVLYSCSDDDYTQLDGSETAPAISTPTSGGEYILLRENANQVATELTWSEAIVSVETPITAYLIEIALADTDFENPIEIATVDELSYSLTVGELNSKAIEAGLTPEVAGNIDLRVSARVGNINGLYIPSEKITLNVTTYPDLLDISTPWGIVGSATPGSWNGPDIPFWQTGESNVFVAYAKLGDGEIKFRMNNSWDSPNINYGGDSSTGGPLVEGGANIPVTAGNYKIVINLNNLTYTINPWLIGVVGDATPNGWDGPDTPMFFDYNSDQFGAIVPLVNGEMKFRNNNEWTTNWGGSGGILSLDGANIPVTAGKSVIIVKFNNVNADNGTYEINSIPNNFGIVGSSTPNGWDGPDIQMNLDLNSNYISGSGVFYLKQVFLLAGELKFRADNDWGLNYGGSGTSGNLELNGGNITIASDGYYDVSFDLSNMTYSIMESVL